MLCAGFICCIAFLQYLWQGQEYAVGAGDDSAGQCCRRAPSGILCRVIWKSTEASGLGEELTLIMIYITSVAMKAEAKKEPQNHDFQKSTALRPFVQKQITGVEPAFPAWEASVLPMNHICVNDFIITHSMKNARRNYKNVSAVPWILLSQGMEHRFTL